MVHHNDIEDRALWHKLRHGRLLLAGNLKLKIYGTLRCRTGKRMKRTNRVFFETEQEAQAAGYRPCGSCMKAVYRKWKCAHEGGGVI